MSSIRPNAEQFQQLAAANDSGPVVMLNLLKFKERADGAEDTGAKEYRRYGNAAVQMIEERGGRVLWQGKAEQVLIGDASEGWDAVALVEYPSRKAFLEMVANPTYMQAHEHRESGLERTIVIACTAAAGKWSI